MIDNQVSWSEDRGDFPDRPERYLIIAEREANGSWSFYEKSMWEISWFPSSSSDIPRLQQSLQERLGRGREL